MSSRHRPRRRFRPSFCALEPRRACASLGGECEPPDDPGDCPDTADVWEDPWAYPADDPSWADPPDTADDVPDLWDYLDGLDIEPLEPEPPDLVDGQPPFEPLPDAPIGPAGPG